MATYPKVMTSNEYCEKLVHIAKDLPTQYRNKYPYNLGYYNAGGYWTWDCWNLPKSLIWGWKETKKVGYFQKYNEATGLGDWTGKVIMSKCTDVSTDFSSVTKGEFLLTPDAGHAGTYIGEFELNGRTYNVVECTVAFGGGVVFSYVSSTGGRYSYKGGSKNSSWAKHGKLPWIDYKEETVVVNLKVLKRITPTMNGPEVKTAQCLLENKFGYNIDVDGYFGPASERIVKDFQKKKGIDVDGIVGGQTWNSLLK